MDFVGGLMSSAVAFSLLVLTFYIGMSAIGYYRKRAELARLKRKRVEDTSLDWADPCVVQVVGLIRARHSFGVRDFPVWAADPLVLYEIDDERIDEVLMDLIQIPPHETQLRNKPIITVGDLIAFIHAKKLHQ